MIKQPFLQQVKMMMNNEESSTILIHSVRNATTMVSFIDADAFLGVFVIIRLSKLGDLGIEQSGKFLI